MTRKIQFQISLNATPVYKAVFMQHTESGRISLMLFGFTMLVLFQAFLVLVAP